MDHLMIVSKQRTWCYVFGVFLSLVYKFIGIMENLDYPKLNNLILFEWGGLEETLFGRGTRKEKFVVRYGNSLVFDHHSIVLNRSAD